ncbi:polysaccharide lyase family 8 super-sandwich domain-containing protein [Catalinimonas niigatensis]|uniref:polysaccharide lyase family 8 super-sandwich domain-containing protein n=1 Tax=Catalinimonas niigatensis TaxID=1397264 RepID=UPI0026668594|nr:polysaccharide lyase family 8 super-sandwich domain-containing protein [Catalinimonas niigatensis]WPP48299.1 polysaccharide lyase family 8 super-sandwich domain-containing protein [Catalinimonas niigatensis]
MSIIRLFIPSIFFFLLHLQAVAYPHPGGMHPQNQIDFVKKKILLKQSPYFEAYLQLVAYADTALTHSDHALPDFNVPGYYIDAQMHRTNSRSLQSDAFDAYACALAYQLSGEEKYADKAFDFLSAWANTNTKYSNHDGSLVMAYSGTAMIMAAELLYHHQDWDEEDKKQFFFWTRNVYGKASNEIRSRKNNWADWGRLGSILSAHLLDDTAEVAENIRLIKSDLFHKIAEDGHMPEEVRREANGIWYTYFSLAPITAACWVALQAEGTDLFAYQENGKSIKSALDYLFYYNQHPDEWKWFDNPRQGSPQSWPGNLFEAMHGIYSNEKYSEYVSEAHPLAYPTHHFAWTFPTLMKPWKAFPKNKLLSQDLLMLRQKVIAEQLELKVDETYIPYLTSTIQDDGRWPDIDYEDVSKTGFEHSRHLENMVDLSRVYKNPESKFYNDPELKRTIDASLNFWLANDFICENWWWNQIGTPDRMVSILLIMDDELSEIQKAKAAPIVNRANLGAWGARPGGDLIKIAGILGKYGLFIKDSEIVEEVMKTMANEIAFATDRADSSDLRGMRPDFSFHHRHDRVNNTLSYGLGYANAFADWAAKVAGTSFSFPEEKIKLLVDFYLDGICKMMVYGKYPDPGAKNRSISRVGTLLADTLGIPEKLLQASNYRQDELEKIVKIRRGEIELDLSVNQFYWHSEYLSHQRPDYFASVRMYSSRNHSMEEPYNGEGLKNHHLGEGSNFISKTGEEYLDIFPVYDWQKIPGTTVVQKASLPAEEEIQQLGLTDFVGAVSDGTYGAASFDFKSPLDPLEAKKAWFFFDQEYVCLGTSIRSEADLPVVTTLNQCYLKEDVVVKKGKRSTVLKKGEHALKKVDWILHDDVAYFFPSPTNVHLKNQEARGSWYSINRQSDSPKEEMSKDVFILWLDHGNIVENASYEYLVVPGIDEDGIEAYQNNQNIEIIANNPKLQAVSHTGLGLSQLVFYQAGEIQITKDIHLAVDNPALLMLQTDGQEIKKITVADPSHKLEAIHLKVSSRINAEGSAYEAKWNEEQGYSDIMIRLPQDEYAGQSVIAEFNLL